MVWTTYKGGFLAAFLLFCTSSVWSGVYTIDFNQGATSGMNIDTEVRTDVPRTAYCSVGADLFTLHSATQYSYYSNNGCGIRLSSKTKDGYIILSLESKKNVTKVVAYASKVLNNTKSTLTFYAGNESILTFGNDELVAYSINTPSSTYYQLPDIPVNRLFKDLMFKAPGGGYVMLHRVDIYIDEEGNDDDAVRSPAAKDDESVAFYNVSGQRIATPLRGVCIKGGRKYIFCR